MKNTDYTITYRENVDAGTAAVIIKGNGHYYDSVKKTFIISAKSITGFKTSSISDVVYNANVYTPKISLSNGDKVLDAKTDYTVKYSKNINVGKASVEIIGKRQL